MRCERRVMRRRDFRQWMAFWPDGFNEMQETAKDANAQILWQETPRHIAIIGNDVGCPNRLLRQSVGQPSLAGQDWRRPAILFWHRRKLRWVCRNPNGASWPAWLPRC